MKGINWNKVISFSVVDLVMFLLSSGLLTIVWNRLAWDNNFAPITYWFAMLIVFTIHTIVRFCGHKWED